MRVRVRMHVLMCARVLVCLMFWYVYLCIFLTQMATAGASSCYLLSSLVGHGITQRFFPARAAWFRSVSDCARVSVYAYACA